MEENEKELIKQVAEQIPVKQMYEDLAKPTIKSTGNILEIIPKTINAALSPLKIWIMKKEYNIEKTKILLENELKYIKPEKITTPEAYIAVPAIQSLSYCMDNEELRKMYAKLLASAMNTDTKDNLHPSYIEIIKQMAPIDAQIIEYISTIHTEPIIQINQEVKTGGHIIFLDNYSNIGSELKPESNNLYETNLQNLERLNLIEISYDQYLAETGAYTKLLNQAKIVNILSDKSHNREVKKGIIKITAYGKEFSRICVK